MSRIRVGAHDLYPSHVFDASLDNPIRVPLDWMGMHYHSVPYETTQWGGYFRNGIVQVGSLGDPSIVTRANRVIMVGAQMPTGVVAGRQYHLAYVAPGSAHDQGTGQPQFQLLNDDDTPLLIGSDTSGGSNACASIFVTLELPQPCAGVKLVRTLDGPGGLSWAGIQSGLNTFNWTGLDRFMEYHTALGRKVLLNLAYTPTANRTSDLVSAFGFVGGAYRPADYTWFANICTAACQRYGFAKLWGIEYGNEAGFNGGSGGFYVDTPASYAQLMRVGYQAVKAVDPRIKTLACGFEAGDLTKAVDKSGRSPPTSNSSIVGLALMADSGDGTPGALYCDGIGIHPYGYDQSQLLDLQNGFKRLRRVLAQCGVPEMPIYATEQGYQVNASVLTAEQVVNGFMAQQMGLIGARAQGSFPYAFDDTTSHMGFNVYPGMQLVCNDITQILGGRNTTYFARRSDMVSYDMTTNGICYTTAP